MQRGQEPGAGTVRAGSGNGNVPEKERRGGDRSGDRPAGAGSRGTSAGSNRKRCRTSPQGLNSGQTMPPSRMLTRNTPPPTSAPSPPRRHPLRASSCCPPPPLAPYLCKLPLACTTTRPVSAPLSPLLLFRKGRRGPPQGRAPGPIVPNTHNQPIAPNTHNRPIARTRTKKERHPLPDAAPWNGCAASTRGRRPYRPLRAGRRTRPAYWPQSSPL